MSLLNKVALVTGGSSGIGAAIAKKFTAEGAKVAIVGRNQDKLKNVTAECEKSGNKPLTIVADVTKDDQLKKVVDDTINKYGQMDILVNNAGIIGGTSIIDSNAVKVFDKVMAVNIRSIVALTNLSVPHLLKTKGNIVNISSVSGLRPYLATRFAYNTSKAAVDHFTKSCALELARNGVRVNGINPGPVHTDIVKNTNVDEAQQAKLWEIMKQGTALGRISDPEEIAELVLFLASDKGRSITGASFVVDNGTVIRA